MTKQMNTASISTLKSSTCKALSGKATLKYQLGEDASKALHFRVTDNDGGGFFSSEWIAWKAIQRVFKDSETVSSMPLQQLFKGKSVNSSGFLLAVLVAEGLMESLPKKARLFKATGKAPAATKAPVAPKAAVLKSALKTSLKTSKKSG